MNPNEEDDLKELLDATRANNEIVDLT